MSDKKPANSREVFLARMNEDRKSRRDREKTRSVAIKSSIFSLIGLIALGFIFVPMLGDTNFHMIFALFIGAVGSIATAIFFFSITFYSSRSGHDDQPNYREMYEKQMMESSRKSRLR